MKLKDFINEYAVYKKVENEIREWVETTYKGLSIDFYELTMEIVRTDPDIDYSAEQTQKITEVVNIKIGDILEAHAEEIYIAERLTRIWKKHPKYNPEVTDLESLKKSKRFLKYLDELIIRTPDSKIVKINEIPTEGGK